jgi:O-antigen/teichoic acid export membrane protein
MPGTPAESVIAEPPIDLGRPGLVRASLIARFRQLLQRLGWPVFTFGGLQGMRLVTNIILSQLLTPAIFGMLQIINTLRTGVELLSDVGVGQNIISNRDGATRSFTSTAWTIQVIRGCILGTLLAACSPLLAHFYAEPILARAVPLAAVLTLIAGFHSTGIFILQREQKLARLSFFELSLAAVASLIQIAISYYDRTVWSLLYGAAICMALQVACSFVMTPSAGLRFAIDRAHARAIVHFGKWIFLSSAVYFVASNFDRLYLSKHVPWALLGVYGIARSLSEVFTILLTRLGMMVIFPIIAGSEHRGAALRQRLSSHRLPLLGAGAAGLALFVALSDRVIFLLYDQRYHEAAAILPVLAAGVWFSILATLGESVSLGVGRPQVGTMANAAKLAWMIGGMPLFALHFGFPGLVACIAAADLIKYLVLTIGQKRLALAFPAQDLVLTAFFVACVIGLRALFAVSGVVGEVAGLWALFR